MLVHDSDLTKYTVRSDATLARALACLNENKLQILFVIDDKLRLVGAFNDGDFRRWVLEQSDIDISQPVSVAMNAQCLQFFEQIDESEIEPYLSEKVRYVPLVNAQGRLVSVVTRTSPVISIDGVTIGSDTPSYVIAEIGNNHNGCLESAKLLVDEAINAGANCVKFQMRDISSLYVNQGNAKDVSEDLGSQYVLDLLSRFQLSISDFSYLFTYCREKGVTALCTPFDQVSADNLMHMGVAGFKVASADLTNHQFLTYLASKGLPLIVSTGMATEDEIQGATSLLKKCGARFILLHCNSTYPTPYKDINLRYLERLKNYSQGLVGYSGHERGYNVPVAAVALGAKVIEKHFTLDRNLEGNDHKVSLLPREFKEMVQAIRQVESALGHNKPRTLSQGEMMNRENLAKSLVANCSIQNGSVIDRDMLAVKSPGKGLAPYHLEQLVGTRAKRSLSKGEFFYSSDLPGQKKYENRDYSLPQRFGIPIRYHDLQLVEKSNLRVVEYHLSYQDLNVNIDDYVSLDIDRQLVVHAPELFEGDHLLDLASPDANYRKLSIKHLNRVFDVARALQRYYPETPTVPVIVNVGGFSLDDFLSEELKQQRYLTLANSLQHLNLDGINMLIQSMPPYPWHFGGQRYHNLFVCPYESATFCRENSVNICLDVSHSWLAKNYLDIEIDTYFKELGDFICHLHIADALGVDDEGLQVGEGEIDFSHIFGLMNKHCADATWLPEIWQGHKNQGEGFWRAFNLLENCIAETPKSDLEVRFISESFGSSMIEKGKA